MLRPGRRLFPAPELRRLRAPEMALGCSAPSGWDSGRQGRPAGGLEGVGCCLALSPPAASRHDALAGSAQLLWVPAMVFLLGLTWPRAGETRGLARAPLRLARMGVGWGERCLARTGGGGGAYCAIVGLSMTSFLDLHSEFVRMESDTEKATLHDPPLPTPQGLLAPAFTIWCPWQDISLHDSVCSFVNWAKDEGCCEACNYHHWMGNGDVTGPE